MNHRKARPLADGSGWHYTVYNDNRGTTTAVGYCADHPGHATPKEAYNCYKKYELDTTLSFSEDRELKAGVTLQECAECKKICTGFAKVGHGIPQIIYLCSDHRNRETVEKYFHVGESFGSF